jgi:hypothetical protein
MNQRGCSDRAGLFIAQDRSRQTAQFFVNETELLVEANSILVGHRSTPVMKSVKISLCHDVFAEFPAQWTVEGSCIRGSPSRTGTESQR